MATYHIDVLVSDNPPAYSVLIKIGGKHIPTAQNTDTNWEGTAEDMALSDPVALEYYGDGISNQRWTLAVTLTPSDGSKEIDYKKSGTLDGNGDFHLVDKISLAPQKG